jgi:hypothetical protein
MITARARSTKVATPLPFQTHHHSGQRDDRVVGLPRSWNPDARSLIHQTLFSRLVRSVCWLAHVVETILEHTPWTPGPAIAPLLASTKSGGH